MILKDKPLDFHPKFEVAGCFVIQDRKILLLLRPEHKPQPNTWNIPAGKVEKEENPLETVVREVKEETGISLSQSDVMRVGQYFIRYKDYDYVYHTFRAVVDSIELKIAQDEAKDFGWFTTEEALSLRLIEDEDFCIKQAFDIVG